MKHLFLVLVLLLAITSTNSRKKAPLNEQTLTKQEKTTIVESNHFYSSKQLGTNYDINEVIPNKSLVFTLKPHNDKSNDKTLADNPITITLTQGSQQQKCAFNNYNNLCSIKNVSSTSLKLKIQCKKLPCELSWLILQPPVVDNDASHPLKTLVEINKDKNHAILHVACNNPDLREKFPDKLQLFTNSNYTKYSTKQGIVFFLFNNEEQGYYLLNSQDQKVRACANASLKHMSDFIELNSKQVFMDYLLPKQNSTYELNKVPEQDFRMEAELHHLQLNKLSNSTGVKAILAGFKGSVRTILKEMSLFVDDQKSYMEFNIVYKKVTDKYDRLQMQLNALGQPLMLSARFVTANTHEIELGQQSFFDLKKGESLDYKIIPLSKQITNIQKVYIFSDDSKFTTTKTECGKQGCEFTIKANEDGQGKIYVGEHQKQQKTQIITQQFEKSITRKAYEGQQLSFSYKTKANKALQLLVNSPSVVVYAASKTKCPVIDEDKCKQTSFNHNFPTIYEPKSDDELLFKVIALDNCQFTLTVINEDTKYVQLKDARPFAYLFDDAENSLVFSFNLKEKSDVSFNLIAPVNELTLFVSNDGSEVDNWDSAQSSTEGFIKFEKDKINGMKFSIKVQKREQFKQKFIHFTIIVSTTQGNLRLEAGLPHYETLKPKDTRDYVFEFNPKEQVLLNFYTHNIKQNVKLGLRVSNADEYDNQTNTALFEVDSEIDTLDLQLVSERLCEKEQGQNCQIFVRIQNKMQVQADVTITLVERESIIELKDGIWQSYDINQATITSHFYFMPKNPNHSATIYYKPSVVDLKILYSIWHSDDLSVQTSEWPFPANPYNDKDKTKPIPAHLQFKPIQFIHVQPAQLKNCWPNCIILMSLVADPSLIANAAKTNMTSLIDAHFRIMGTNNFLQLPEKHRVDVLLSKDENKQMLVDLKYHLDKPSIVLRTHYTLGTPVLTANVYSQNNPRCPTPGDEADFKLDNIQTAISIEDIKKKLGENSMQQGNAYLCVLSHAPDSTKFNIEFTSDSEGVTSLSIDSTSTFRGGNKVQFYTIDYSQQAYIKMTRNEGFPYINHKICKPEQQNCVSQFLETKEKGIQLADKVGAIDDTYCPKCVLLVRIESVEMSELVIHVQSKYTELELVQNQVMNDALEKEQQNRYTLTGTKQEQIIINIQINSGNLKVQVHDFQKISISKTNPSGSKNIHIAIPPRGLDYKNEGQSQGAAYSHFVHLHITVQSQDHKQPASYTITYSSGTPIVYLQDGLIMEYTLMPKKKTQFIYHNPTNHEILLYTSATNAESLKKIKSKYYAMDDQGDEDTQIQITPEKNQFQKKAVNPTSFVKLPGKQHYLFSLTNEDDKTTVFTIGINNRQIIYLPFDHDLPIELDMTQKIYIAINSAASGYVKLSFSKCALGQPYIGYTLDYNEFVNEQFQIEQQMTEDLYSELVIKVKAQSGIYVKLRSPDDDGTLMAIKATFSPQKIQPSRSKPGDKGLVQYQILDSTKAQLTFTSLVCGAGKKNCQKDFVYSSLSSTSIDSVYAQLVCPSIMFDLPYMKKMHTANLTKIPSSSGNKITFTQPISNQIEYIGIKAVNTASGEIVYYQPIEIVTFWGQLHRSESTTFVLAGVLILVAICTCLMIFRRYQKTQGYQTLGALNDNID